MIYISLNPSISPSITICNLGSFQKEKKDFIRIRKLLIRMY